MAFLCDRSCHVIASAFADAVYNHTYVRTSCEQRMGHVMTLLIFLLRHFTYLWPINSSSHRRRSIDAFSDRQRLLNNCLSVCLSDRRRASIIIHKKISCWVAILTSSVWWWSYRWHDDHYTSICVPKYSFHPITIRMLIHLLNLFCIELRSQKDRHSSKYLSFCSAHWLIVYCVHRSIDRVHLHIVCACCCLSFRRAFLPYLLAFCISQHAAAAEMRISGECKKYNATAERWIC